MTTRYTTISKNAKIAHRLPAVCISQRCNSESLAAGRHHVILWWCIRRAVWQFMAGSLRQLASSTTLTVPVNPARIPLLSHAMVTGTRACRSEEALGQPHACSSCNPAGPSVTARVFVEAVETRRLLDDWNSGACFLVNNTSLHATSELFHHVGHEPVRQSLDCTVSATSQQGVVNLSTAPGQQLWAVDCYS